MNKIKVVTKRKQILIKMKETFRNSDKWTLII